MKKLFALLLTLVMIVSFGFAVLTHTNLDTADRGSEQSEQIESVNFEIMGDPWPPPDET